MGSISNDAGVAMTNGHTSNYRYPQRYLGQARPIRIVMVGCGVTGIAAVKLYKDAFPEREVELVIYEKNDDITGTWLENRYPG
jgi:cation diffusion facilitator CzcD-associated flavoprotein CzcO